MPRYAVNQPNVVFESFDEEIVLVNLETGNYYSVQGCGPALWTALAAGAPVDRIAAGIAAADGGDQAAIGAAVALFADALVAAELLVRADGPGTDAPVAWTGAFVPPTLEAYADMQELLMLDPIHDVDTAGWPVAKEG